MRGSPGRRERRAIRYGSRSRIPGKPHVAGSKIARRFTKHNGVAWKGEVFHGGELTVLNNVRALKRLDALMDRQIAAA